MQKKKTDITEYEQLLKKYIEVFNRAVKENQDKFPYKEMLDAVSSTVKKGHDLDYVIYDSRPKGAFKLRLENGELEIVDKDKEPSEEFCSISYDYLKDVVENSEEYIKHPERLNWDLLKLK